MKKEEVQLISFKIISIVGDALDCYGKAITAAKNKDFDQSDEEFKKGDNLIAECHKIQTELLKCECNNEDIDFSIILIHAQDHLMTTLNYERLAKEIVELYKKI